MEKISYMGKDTAKQIVGSITGVPPLKESDYILAVEDGKIVKLPNPAYDGYYGIEFERGAADGGGTYGYHKMIGTEEALANMEVHKLIRCAKVVDGKIAQVLENMNFYKDTEGEDVDLSGADGGDIVQLLGGSDTVGVWAIMGGTDETYDRFIVGTRPFIYEGDMAMFVPLYGESVDHSTVIDNKQRCVYDEDAAGSMGTQNACITEGFDCYKTSAGYPKTSISRFNYELYARNKNEDTTKNAPYCNANTLDLSFLYTLLFIECRTKWMFNIFGGGMTCATTPSEENWGTVSGFKVTDQEGVAHYFNLNNTAIFVDDGADPTSLAKKLSETGGEALFVKRQEGWTPDDGDDDGDVQTLATVDGTSLYSLILGGNYPSVSVMEVQRDISQGCVEGTFEAVACDDGTPIDGPEEGVMTGIWTKTMSGKILCAFSAEEEVSECDIEMVIRLGVWRGRVRDITPKATGTYLSGSDVLLHIDEDGNRQNLLFQAKSRDDITTDTDTTNKGNLEDWAFTEKYENLGDIGSTSGFGRTSIKSKLGRNHVHSTGTGSNRSTYEGAYRNVDTSTTTVGVYIRRLVLLYGNVGASSGLAREVSSNNSPSSAIANLGGGFVVAVPQTRKG